MKCHQFVVAAVGFLPATLADASCARKMLCCCTTLLRKQGDQKSKSWGQKPGPRGCAGSPLASMRHLCSCRRSSASCLSLQHHKSLSHSSPLHSFIHSRHYHTITHSLPAHSHSLTPMNTHFSHYSLTLTNSLSLTHSHSLTFTHSRSLTHHTCSPRVTHVQFRVASCFGSQHTNSKLR